MRCFLESTNEGPARRADPAVRVVKARASISRTSNFQILERRRPVNRRIARGNRVVRAVASQGEPPPIGAIPARSAVVLAAAEREVRVRGADRAVIKLRELKIRIVIRPTAAAIDRAPHTTVAADDQPRARPGNGMKVNVHSPEHISPGCAVESFDADRGGINHAGIRRINDDFLVIP